MADKASRNSKKHGGTSASTHSAADPKLKSALAAAFRQGALPGENEGFDEGACDAAASFVLGVAMQRRCNHPKIEIESVSGNGARRHMRLAIVNDNMPFLVDSIAATVSSLGLAIDRIIHPVVSVRRNEDGELQDIFDHDASGERRESVVYLEVERADARARRQLQSALESSMADVHVAVEDWSKLQEAMGEDAEGLSDIEGAALLRWFLEGNLTLLGHFRCTRKGELSGQLGICRVGDKVILARDSLDKAFAWFDNGGAVPLIIKSNHVSTVHRRVPVDLLIVPMREDGAITGLSVHGGIWTSAALAAPPERVPLLRAQLKALVDKFGFDPSGHAGKALAHALTALPHDLLLSFRMPDLERVALTFMSLADRPRPKLLTVESALGRHLFTFVWLPRDELSTGRRVEIETMLCNATGAEILSRAMTLEDGDVAMLRYVLDTRASGQKPDSMAMDAKLKRMVRGWAPAVESELALIGDESRAAALAGRYAEFFPASYRTSYGSAEAALDIMRLRELGDSSERTARLYRLTSDTQHCLRLKLYSRQGAISLSDAVPVLENFGFGVLEEVPTPLGGGRHGYIHDFLLRTENESATDALIERASVIEVAIADVLQGRAEDDLFNQLIAGTGLDPQTVVWLRAWYRYLRQTGLSYGMGTVVDALRDAPSITRALTTLFAARHDPGFDGAREDAEKQARNAIRLGLTHVSAIDDDRLLRLFRELVLAILRTNAFASSANDALAFKIDSARVPGLPAPLPWREVFVYSPSVEGIHLRAGPVARGGLRWSDRRDDFRTEILGLMKAQRVKNAVIVPTGAKGGFFPKNLPSAASDREGWLAGGKAAYQCFIRTLLSITDNIVDGKVIHPDRIVIRDGEDPYFVVAADKGTATFSDIANAIARERGFWLGDAFASGGSQGYDHKAMGITARGAWVSVQRHFAEMDVDVQTDNVTVAGCGDMSGDVFGNGMLLSKSLKLVAAFDHRHIFIDPDPDPAKSWKERKRLFDLPRSSWEDYSQALISKGGGVFARSLKTIKVSPQMRTLLDIEDKELEPNQLISAILRAKVDLLWFGGIGTYIKSSEENNVTVGDPANDALRIDGDALRCKVIGEGANLGTTQAGRIEFALRGGRVNTDFIDNSAGVDCSDNEVNIKIGLNGAIQAGTLDSDARNALLVAMTGDVSTIVLEDNRLQALGLSIAEQGGGDALPSYIRLIEKFEEMGRLDRAVEGLATNDDLQRRIADSLGLARPELAVLLSTAKLTMQDAIEASPLIGDPTMEPEILSAFPREMREKYPDAILDHQLRGEIVATKVANRIINRLGMIHPYELAEEEGCSLGHVAVAFVAAERLFGLGEVWAKLDNEPLSEQSRLAFFERTAVAVRSQMADLLRASTELTHPQELVELLSAPIEELASHVDELLTDEAISQMREQVEDLVSRGASRKLADMIAHLYKMDGAVGLGKLSHQSGVEAQTLTRAFTNLGSVLGLDWTQMTAARMSPSDPWERLLVAGLARDFQQMRLEFFEAAKTGKPVEHVESWAGSNEERIAQFRRLVSRAQLAPSPSIAMLAQIAGQARILLGR